MEVITVLRILKGKNKSSLESMSSEEQSKFVLRESKQMYDKLIIELIKIPNIKLELGRRIDLNVVMSNALDILHKIRGKVKSYGKPHETDHRHIRYTAFKGVGSNDIIHALLARDAGCDDLITFDRDFEELVEFDEFDDLKFRVLKW